jgi:alpha 1,2-mannosyltransferase
MQRQWAAPAEPAIWERRSWNSVAHAVNLAIAQAIQGNVRERWKLAYGEWFGSSLRLGNALARSPRQPLGRYVLREEWISFVRFMEESLQIEDISPRGRFQGAGVVMAIGKSQRYGIPALVTLRLLRMLGCRLPVEIWYSSARGESPFVNGLEAALRRMNRIGGSEDTSDEAPLYFRDLDALVPLNRDLGGWASLFAIKPLAVAYSKFAQVLYLDADAHPVRDPTYLFTVLSSRVLSGSNASRAPSAIFWPDYWSMPVDHPAFSIFQVAPQSPRQRREQESSILLVDKTSTHHAWIPLLLSIMLNIRSDYTYQYLHGDKDTFRFAWMALDSPFYRIETDPAAAGYWSEDGTFQGTTMVQHDPDGEPLVLHQNLEKLDICTLARSGQRPSGRIWDAVQFDGHANWTTGGRWIGPKSRICFTGPHVKTIRIQDYLRGDYETYWFRPALEAVLADPFAKQRLRHPWSRCATA